MTIPKPVALLVFTMAGFISCQSHASDTLPWIPGHIEHLTGDTYVLSDEKHHVTCWVSSSTGYNMAISCLPNKSFE